VRVQLPVYGQGKHRVTQDKDARFQFRISEALLKKALLKARREDLTLSQVIRRLLRQWLDEDPLEPEKDSD